MMKTYGYSLETPCRGASNGYPQHMFSLRSKKIQTFWLKKAPYQELCRWQTGLVLAVCIWRAMQVKGPYVTCRQCRPKSAYANVYADQSLHCPLTKLMDTVVRARENRKNSRSGPKLRILDRFQTPQNANKSVQHFPNQPIFTNQWCLKNHKRSSLSKLTTFAHLLNAILW